MATPIDHERRDLKSAIEEGNVEKVRHLTEYLDNYSLKLWRPGYKILCQALTNKHLEISKILINCGCKISKGEEPQGSALHFACTYGDLETIKSLVDRGASFELKNEENFTAFHLFAKRHPVDQESSLILDYILLQEGININLKDSSTRFTLLHLAAESGNLEMISLLLTRNSSLGVQANRNQTPLHIASLNGQAEAVRLLLESGANYGMQDYFEKTSLCLAVEKEDLKTIQVFLDHFSYLEPGTQKLSPIKADSMLIYCATETQNASVVEMLLLRGASPNNYWDKYGDTPLHLAVEKGLEDIVRLLLEHGAAPNKPRLIRSRGSTELHIAAEMCHEGIFKILLKYGAHPGKENDYRLNALHIATKRGSLPMVRAVLESGYDIASLFTVDLVEGRTPLHNAVKFCSEDVVSLILDQGVPVNTLDSSGLSPLHLAAQRGNLELVQLLLKHGAEISYRYFHCSLEETVESPLYFAAEAGNAEIVDILSESSRIRNDMQERYTAMYIAAYKGHEVVVKMLLHKGVALNNNFGKYLSPLHIASQQGHLGIVNLLLLHGADINPKKIDGDRFSTPLIAAAASGNEEIVGVLLDLGADVHAKINVGKADSDECFLKYGYTSKSYQFSNIEYWNGFSPMHCAAESGKKEVIEMLLKNGAYVNSITENNTTPLSVAVERGNEEAVKCLLESGGRIDLEVQGQYPLFVAIRNKNLAIVKLIFNHINPGRIPNYSFLENGFSPLLSAVVEQALDIVEYLLQNGSNPDFHVKDHPDPLIARSKTDIRDEFPLHVAAEMGDEGIVRKLVEFGASLDSVCSHGLTPLFHAMKAGRIENMKLLLRKGASFEKTNSEGYSLLHWALKDNINTKMIKFLLESGADVNFKCNDLLPIDNLYIYSDNTEEVGYDGNDEEEVLNYLLKFGSSVLRLDKRADRLLCADSELGYPDSTKSLLYHGADINILDKTGRSPLDDVYSEIFRIIRPEGDQGRRLINLEDKETFLKIDLDSVTWVQSFPYENYQGIYKFSEYDELMDMTSDLREVAKLWTERIVKMESVNKKVSEENLVIVRKAFFERYYQKCQKEIDVLKKTVVSDNITFHDILTADEKKLVHYARNRNITEIFEFCDYKELFPLYGKELEFRMKKAVEERNLIEMSVGFLFQVLRVRLPILIVHEIFAYLSFADLRNLCRIRDRFIFVTVDAQENSKPCIIR